MNHWSWPRVIIVREAEIFDRRWVLGKRMSCCNGSELSLLPQRCDHLGTTGWISCNINIPKYCQWVKSMKKVTYFEYLVIKGLLELFSNWDINQKLFYVIFYSHNVHYAGQFFFLVLMLLRSELKDTLQLQNTCTFKSEVKSVWSCLLLYYRNVLFHAIWYTFMWFQFKAQPGVTLRNALAKGLARRDLETSDCKVIRTHDK